MGIKYKKRESGYEKHLEHMKTGYSDLLKELYFEKYTGNGALSFLGSMVRVDNIKDLEDLNLERGYDLGLAQRGYGETGLELPVFACVKNCEWYPNENSDKGGPVLLAILDHESIYENSSTPLRRRLLDEIEKDISAGLYAEKKISFPTSEWNDKDYIALPAKIWCEESSGGDKLILTEGNSEKWNKSVLKDRKEVLPRNEKRVKGLVDATEKYIGITRSYEFLEEEQRLKELPSYVAELFAKIDNPKNVRAILENFRLGNALTVNIGDKT
ncbi:MAG: hypothetical protein KAT28_02615 [Candidatus Aenigmarchaeota archaeon]|nr:hypothetical protein [Candidatus Aenigmarchaeota archaeon]